MYDKKNDPINTFVIAELMCCQKKQKQKIKKTKKEMKNKKERAK